METEVEAIARRIRQFRTDEGLTLKELGDRAGVSPSTIHKIENGQTIPTISVLLKVANGLRRPATELFEGPVQPVVFRHVRPAEATSFAMRTGGARVERIAGAVPNGGVDLWRLLIEPGAGIGVDQPLSYAGELIIYVESGTLDVTVEGECTPLETGDTLHFLTHHAHCWQNIRETPVSALFFGKLTGAFTSPDDP